MRAPAPIALISLGIHAQAVLEPEAQAALIKADYVLGSERQWQCVQHLKPRGEFVPLPKLPQLAHWLRRHRDHPLAILASGDGLHYGIGRWLAQHTPSGQLHAFPGISSIQACCHALGIAQQDLKVVSLHGRPLSNLRRHLAREPKILCLTDAQSQPKAIAQLCCETGYADSIVQVCEDLGYPQQCIRAFAARELADGDTHFSTLHVTLIERRGAGGYLPSFPGITDEHWVSDKSPGRGMFTKREVRVAILSWLQLQAGEVLWDIGAGCGSVAVESAYWCERAQVYAIEQHPERWRCLAANRERFGVGHNLHLVAASAPRALDDLPPPDKVFIGGSGGALPEILLQAWQALPNGGLLLASSVTAESEQHLHEFAQREDVAQHTLRRLQVTQAQTEKRPVTLSIFQKASTAV